MNNSVKKKPGKRISNTRFRYMLPLNSHACFIRNDQTGSKASRLARLLLDGYPVPDGFVLPVRAFRDFCRYNDIPLGKRPVDTARIQEKIMKSPLPEKIANEIDAVKQLLADTVAVRSSSVAEDSIEFSMAGQYQTFTDVTHTSIIPMIKKCWCSIFDSSVAHYSKKVKIADPFRLAVIIQNQVDPDFSGVMFTIDPIIHSTDNMVCEWVRGHCEKLVSGKVNPQRAYINRTSLALSADTPIPAQMRTPVTDLARYAKEIELAMGHPLDIEWCIEKGKPFLLQARPVTTLSSHRHTIWTNVNMTENFPLPLTPLSWNAVDTFYTMYMRSILKLFGWNKKRLDRERTVINNLTGIHSSHIYYNLNNWYEVLYFFPISKWLVRFLDNYIGQNVPFTFSPSVQGRGFTAGITRPVKSIAFFFRLTALFIRAGRRITRFEKKFSRFRASLEPASVKGAHGFHIEKARSLFSFIENNWMGPASGDIMAMIFPGLFKTLADAWLPGNGRDPVLTLMQGIDIKSLEPTKQIAGIASGIKKDPVLIKLLAAKKYNEVEHHLPADIQNEVDAFFNLYGERCYYDCMLDFPTFKEEHSLFWDLVAGYTQVDDPQALFRAGNYRAKKQTIRQVLKGIPVIKKTLIKTVLKLSYTSIQLRERARLCQSFIFADLRSLFLSVGSLFRGNGYLSHRDDIFFLDLAEITAVIYGKYLYPAAIDRLVQERKEEHKKNHGAGLPEFFLTPKGGYFNKYNEFLTSVDHDTGNNQLQGIGVSRGVVSAAARIILDPRDSRQLKPGEILVTRSTDPGWTPLFLICSGLVLEKGGMLSHGAIVAREFNIPAVTSVAGATTKIKNGTMLTINGATGTIKTDKKGVQK